MDGGTLWCFRRTGPDREPDRRQEPSGIAKEKRARPIVCSRCGHRITSTRARVEVAGSHEHSRVNPDGLTFRIGCFSRARGCKPLGGSTLYWTWFEGYAWQVVVCGACGTHLGWLYRSPDGRFYGLILDRLRQLDG